MTLQLINKENFGHESVELLDNGREYIVRVVFKDGNINFVIDEKHYAFVDEAGSQFNKVIEEFGIA